MNMVRESTSNQKKYLPNYQPASWKLWSSQGWQNGSKDRLRMDWSGGALTTKKKIPNWQPALFYPWKPSTETHYAQSRYEQTAAHAIPISTQQELWASLYQHEPLIGWFGTFPPIALSKLANCIHSEMFPKLLAGETMTTQQFDLPL